MSPRRFRRLLLVVLAAGVGYWIYKDRPTLSGIIDAITNPLMGSRAAVNTSERNRVVGDATSAVSEQSQASVAAIREGMTASQLRETLGDPDKIEEETVDGVAQTRWTFRKAKRVVILRQGRAVSIIVQ
jgi:hypothetical protein